MVSSPPTWVKSSRHPREDGDKEQGLENTWIAICAEMKSTATKPHQATQQQVIGQALPMLGKNGKAPMQMQLVKHLHATSRTT